jgi:hypothetical protein
MRLMTVALMLIATSPAVADETRFPISIPYECVELAHREGVPVVIENRYQATKAKLKLARMSNRDPLVRECRAAVERTKAALRYEPR